MQVTFPTIEAGIVFRLLLISSVMRLSGDQLVGFCYITAKPGEGPPLCQISKVVSNVSPCSSSLKRTRSDIKSNFRLRDELMV